MVTDQAYFWDAIGHVSEQEIMFLQGLGIPRRWADARGDDDAQRVVAYARAVLRALRDSMPAATRSSVASPKDAKGRQDARWTLLRDLELARAEAEPWIFSDDEYTPEDPLTITHEPVPAMMRDVAGAHGWVTVRFDDRLSLAAVIAEIKRTWPKGLPSSRRPLGDRKLTLVRLVCLESKPTDTWRARLAAWNERSTDTPADKPFPTAWALQNAFKKAEESLAGKDGLRWYYDQEYRDSWWDDLLARVAANVRAASKPMVDDFAAAVAGFADREQSSTKGGESE